MKHSLIATLTISLFIGCSSDSKMMKTFESNINNRFSEIERKGLEIKKTELSDRETYNEILKYHQERWQKSAGYSLSFIGTESEEKYKKMSEEDFRLVNESLKELEKAKGEKRYFKIEYLKIQSIDTLHYGVSYFDENQELIKQIDKK